MKLCPECVYPVCDFCSNYVFNPNHTGAYTGHGFCRIHHKMIDPEGDCEDFECANLSPEGMHPAPREPLDTP